MNEENVNAYNYLLFSQLLNMIEKYENTPKDRIPEDELTALELLHSKLNKTLGISDGINWSVNWQVEKYADDNDFESGTPYEVCYSKQNVVLNVGIREMLSVITGTGGIVFSAANAHIGVGTDGTRDGDPTVTNLIATAPNRSYAPMDATYPQVSSDGFSMVYAASFGENAANFAWNEVVVANGDFSGVAHRALNRKVVNLGTKSTGTWRLIVTITMTATP